MLGGFYATGGGHNKIWVDADETYQRKPEMNSPKSSSALKSKEPGGRMQIRYSESVARDEAC